MKKNERTITFTSVSMCLCILLNYIGKVFAVKMELPLWLDSIGTGVSACLLGPVCGAMCGVSNNIIYGIQNPISLAYMVTSMMIGVVIGVCKEKGYMNNLFQVMSVSAVISVLSVCISAPLNCIFFRGYSSNVWGDALFEMFRQFHVPMVLASVISELFVDFPDKILTVCFVYLIVKIVDSSLGKKIAKFSKYKFYVLMAFLFLGTVYGTGKQAQASESLASDLGYYTQTVYNSDNGLIGGEANDIAETKDGYIWVGTYAGLYCYNGTTFRPMTELKSVKNVNCLFVDEEGRLWIGTNDNGLAIYVKDKISNSLNVAEGLPSSSIRYIKEDSNGYYYVGTSEALCVLSMNNGLKIVKVIPEITYTDNIAVSQDGTVSVVTNDGSLYFLEDMEIVEKKTLSGGNYFKSCMFTSKGELLTGTTTNQVYKWKKNKKGFQKTETITLKNRQDVSEISQDKEGNYWFCANNGIGYRNAKGEYVDFDSSQYNSSIKHMIQDYQGNLWFTSTRMGLLKVTKSSFCNLSYPYGLSGNKQSVANAVVKWKNKLYIGTDNGLNIIDEKNGKTQKNGLTKRLKGIRIRGLMVDSKEHLWIASSGEDGLLEVKENLKVKKYGWKDGTLGNRFRSIVEQKDGTIVAAENTGLDFIKNGKVVYTIGEENGLISPQILSVVEENKGTLLAGTDGSGIAVIKNKKVIQWIQEEEGLTSGVILRIIPVEKNYLVVTSNSLCVMDENYQCREITDFPYSNNYDAIVSQNGDIWVLSGAGIYVVNGKKLVSGKKFSYELLDGKKGLNSALTANAWNYLDEKQNLYLCCNTGVYKINIKEYNNYKTPFRMRLDYVVSDGTKYYVDKSEKTIIEGNAEQIEINPVIMNYSLEDPYISYYLEGFDKKKTILRQSELSTIVYTNLPAGKYHFVISVLDSATGNMIESSRYELERGKRLWENWWFMYYFVVVCIIAVVYITWLITKINSNRIIRQQNREIQLAKKQAEMGNETILAIARTVDAKDENTSQHSERVAQYSVMIAKKLGWDEKRCEDLRKTALLHDIGKIGIPDSILNKTSRLTDEEYRIMKSHVEIGAEILKDFTIVDNVADGACYHHERYDGKGYVHGLQGEEIPINARIIGIADTFDAITANRVYRKGMSKEYALSELKKGAGTQFDPALTKIMISLIETGEINPFSE